MSGTDYRPMVQQVAESIAEGDTLGAKEASLNIAIKLLEALYLGGNNIGSAPAYLGSMTQFIEGEIQKAVKS